MNLQFVGYHGTLMENGNNLLRQKVYIYSNGPDEWLGKGVYFFEKVKHARIWCIDKKCNVNNKEYMLVKSDITCDDSNIIDMTQDGMRESYLKLMGTLEISVKKYIRDKKLDGKRVKGDGFVFNHMYEKFRKFDMVRALFFNEDEYYKMYRDLTRFLDQQIQICVRNRDCIKSIELCEKGSI